MLQQVMHWVATRPSWGHTSDQCPGAVDINSPLLQIDACATLQFALSSDASVYGDSVDTGITVGGTSMIAANATNKGILIARFDASTQRLVDRKAFDITQSPTFTDTLAALDTYLRVTVNDGEIIALVADGPSLSYLSSSSAPAIALNDVYGALMIVNNRSSAATTTTSPSSSPPIVAGADAYTLLSRKRGSGPVVEAITPSTSTSHISTSQATLSCDNIAFRTGVIGNLTVMSAGLDDAPPGMGGDGSIVADGVELYWLRYLNVRRTGFSAAVFDGRHLSVKSYGHWDTYASTQESDDMATWINTVQSANTVGGSGDVVCIIVVDEASNSLTLNLRNALKGVLGSQLIDRLSFRSSYALVSRLPASGSSMITATVLTEGISSAGMGAVTMTVSNLVGSATFTPSTTPSTGVPTPTTGVTTTPAPSATPTIAPSYTTMGTDCALDTLFVSSAGEFAETVR